MFVNAALIFSTSAIVFGSGKFRFFSQSARTNNINALSWVLEVLGIPINLPFTVADFKANGPALAMVCFIVSDAYLLYTSVRFSMSPASFSCLNWAGVTLKKSGMEPEAIVRFILVFNSAGVVTFHKVLTFIPYFSS
ncbi:hypothetical protein D3C73_1104650 [compost metagenome]